MKIYVGAAMNAGNPESAITAYLKDNEKIRFSYFDSGMIGKLDEDIECIKLDRPMYFVSRDNQTAGLGKYLLEVKQFKKPVGESFIGVYKLKENCSGKTINLSVDKQ